MFRRHCHARRAAQLIVSLMLCCNLFLVANAQTPKVQDSRPDLWRWTKEAKHLDCVVQIKVNGSLATGVILKVNSDVKKANGIECHMLTAYHVVEAKKQSDAIEVTYRNGKRIKGCRVVAFDDRHDLAILKTWAPAGTKAAKLANDSVTHNMYLEFAGLGGAADLRSSLRHFSSKATQPTSDKFIYADETLLPGDSGGPVFNKKKELVGIISGGWFWWDAGIKSSEGIPILSTWPARASNLVAIEELMSELKDEEFVTQELNSEALDGEEVMVASTRQIVEE